MPFAGKALYSDRIFPKYEKFASKRASVNSFQASSASKRRNNSSGRKKCFSGLYAMKIPFVFRFPREEFQTLREGNEDVPEFE